MTQASLPLAQRSRRGFAAFVEDAGNRAALRYVSDVTLWPSPVALLLGPAGSGKSHLGEAFAEPDRVFVDDADAADEEDLFARINRALAGEVEALLVASRLPPSEWDIAMPDLSSRLGNVPVLTLAEPGDAVLGEIVRRLFADHGRAVDAEVVSYMLTRLPRSIADLAPVVNAIERAAQSERADVTKRYVARWLGRNDTASPEPETAP